MRCRREGDIIKHGFKSRCFCDAGFLYDYATRACTHTDTAKSEKKIEDKYEKKIAEARLKAENKNFQLRQTVEFGHPDPNYGGSIGGWRCSDPGDESWQLGVGGVATRKVVSDKQARGITGTNKAS